jgi:tRNA threonylcarbamoyladenosine biosynthesis protein TsaE
MPPLSRVTRSAAATQRLGEALGRLLRAGDVVALGGDLGAGKTCFAQGLARGLGVSPEERVQSPTFTIVSEHAGRLPLYHMDLYRIGGRGELADLGLEQYLEGAGVCAVEWLDRFPELAPADHLELRLAIVGPRRRTLTAVAHGPRSAELCAAWLGEIADRPG